MPRLTLIFPVMLIIVSAIGYPTDSGASPKGRNTEQYLTSITVDVKQALTAPKRSITALILAFTGVLLALFGGTGERRQVAQERHARGGDGEFIGTARRW